MVLSRSLLVQPALLDPTTVRLLNISANLALRAGDEQQIQLAAEDQYGNVAGAQDIAFLDIWLLRVSIEVGSSSKNISRVHLARDVDRAIRYVWVVPCSKLSPFNDTLHHSGVNLLLKKQECTVCWLLTEAIRYQDYLTPSSMLLPGL